jgi:hypothetical protein
MKTVQCPSCGASATNLENCEFCGSLFVRYPSNDIKIKINTSPNAFEGFIFPNLKEALLENIAFQSNSETLTDICLLDHTVIIQVVSSSTLVDFFNNPSKPGLGIYLAFDDDKETEKKFLDFKESKFFKKFMFDGIPTYSIDFGKDAMGSAFLISKILIEVYGLERNTMLKIEHQAGISENESNGYCFVATATMGSYNHPTVVQLRNFRDYWILNKSWGASFVKWYYHYGAIVAARIENRRFIRIFCYFIIIKPLHFLSKLLIK